MSNPARPKSSLSDVTDILFVLSLAALFGVASFQPFPGFLNWFYDDSFFYSKIAENVAKHGTLSFDGRNMTNGFHPLWLAIQVVCFKLYSPTPESFARFIFLVELSVSAVALMLIRRVALRRFGCRPWISFLCLAAYSYLLLADNFGQEAHLLGLLFAYFLYIIHCTDRYSWHRLRLMTICCSLMYLTRTDTPIMCWPVLLHVALYRRLNTLKPVQWIVLVGILVVPPVALSAFNYLYWGHFTTISASLKTTSTIVLTPYKLWFFLEQRRPLVACVLALLGISIYRRRIGTPLSMLCVGILAYFGVLLLFSTGAIGSWYLVIPNTVGILVAGHLLCDLQSVLERSSATARMAKYAPLLSGIAVAVLLLNHFLYRKWPVTRVRAPAYALARDLREFPERATYFMVDGTGIVAFFSGRSIINGDGLVNNFAYQEHVRAGKLREYLRQQSVDYYIEHFFMGGEHNEYELASRAEHVEVNAIPSWKGDGVPLRQDPPLRFTRDMLVYQGNDSLIFDMKLLR